MQIACEGVSIRLVLRGGTHKGLRRLGEAQALGVPRMSWLTILFTEIDGK